MPPSLLL